MMNKPFNIQDVIAYIKKELQPHYSAREIESLYCLIFEHTLKCSKIDIHLNRKTEIDVNHIKKIQNYIELLKIHKPIQYILGETEFYNLRFKVDQHTLIPRPETEELVDWIININKQKAPSILDVGTGCGCIPIALSKNIPQADVVSVDISEKALSVAKENARLNETKVQFYQRDILKWKSYNWENYFDIIVSNPPYVRESEKEMIKPNVLDYEPENALFVPDSDPLIFYRAIANFAKEYLYDTGLLFFEINEFLGNEMIKLLNQTGFTDIHLKKDINGKDRIIYAIC